MFKQHVPVSKDCGLFFESLTKEFWKHVCGGSGKCSVFGIGRFGGCRWRKSITTRISNILRNLTRGGLCMYLSFEKLVP